MAAKKAKLVLAIFTSVGFAFIIILQTRGLSKEEGSATWEKLIASLPDSIEGWNTSELPIGETESVTETTIDVLGSDHVIHREYKKSSTTLTLFIVHWPSGSKVLPREVAFHSPDHCWTRVGFERNIISNDFSFNYSGRTLAPGKFRRFEIQDQKLFVVFWQLFGKEVVSFTDEDEIVPSDKSFLDDFISGRAWHRQEQYFVRLSCNRDFRNLSENEVLISIFQSLAPIGIEEQ